MSPNNNINANRQLLQPKGPKAIHRAWSPRTNPRRSEHMRRRRPPIDQILVSSEETLSRRSSKQSHS